MVTVGKMDSETCVQYQSEGWVLQSNSTQTSYKYCRKAYSLVNNTILAISTSSPSGYVPPSVPMLITVWFVWVVIDCFNHLPWRSVSISYEGMSMIIILDFWCIGHNSAQLSASVQSFRVLEQQRETELYWQNWRVACMAFAYTMFCWSRCC